jgi:hypothetical protein
MQRYWLMITGYWLPIIFFLITFYPFPIPTTNFLNTLYKTLKID